MKEKFIALLTFTSSLKNIGASLVAAVEGWKDGSMSFEEDRLELFMALLPILVSTLVQSCRPRPSLPQRKIQTVPHLVSTY